MIIINIGVDIGGNHVGIGLVSDDAKILKKDILDYHTGEISPKEIMGFIDRFVNLNSESLESIGIGVPGVAKNTFIEYTCNLPLSGIEIKDYIKTLAPIYVSNDAKCAAIAEYELIDRKKYSNYAFVTIGTGIGMGLIINGKLYTGKNGFAGEIGHMVIEKDGIKCKCGREGCFEQYASITALKRMTQLDDLKEIFYIAEKNENMKSILNQYYDNLAEGLANLINLYDVEIITIGGSLSRFGNKFIEILKEKIYMKIYNNQSYNLNIKTAELRNDAGILGASLLHKYV